MPALRHSAVVGTSVRPSSSRGVRGAAGRGVAVTTGAAAGDGSGAVEAGVGDAGGDVAAGCSVVAGKAIADCPPVAAPAEPPAGVCAAATGTTGMETTVDDATVRTAGVASVASDVAVAGIPRGDPLQATVSTRTNMAGRPSRRRQERE